MDIICVTLDCADPARVAEFWNAALGWGGVAAAPDGSGAICGPPDGGTYLECIRVPEPKTVKNRMHLGLTAGPLDALDAEIARLEALGATVAWEEEFPPAWPSATATWSSGTRRATSSASAAGRGAESPERVGGRTGRPHGSGARSDSRQLSGHRLAPQ